MITLHSGQARAEVHPEMGAGLAGLWVGGRPALRPWSGKAEDGPFALALNLLVPFSNRISGGGFLYDGQHHTVDPNLPGERFPIHGDGFQRAWRVEESGPTAVSLSLEDGKIGPFRYAALVTYRLAPDSLIAELSATNTGEIALPFGLGFHPWFPRDADTRLAFSASGYWPETPDHLPATATPLPLEGGTWRRLSALPEGWINQGFSGWDGMALVEQGPRAVTLRISAPDVTTAIVYSPSDTADFFCFEPVSHPVDAHNLDGQPGLVRLAPGETQTITLVLHWGEPE